MVTTVLGSAWNPEENNLLVGTTAEFEDIADALNTTAVTGWMGYNTTTNKPVWKDGDTAADVWVDATGSTEHTPV